MKIYLSLFRTSHWWNYIFPPILGILYLVLLNEESKFEDIWLQLILFFISFVFTASFGFFYNDFCDIESDNKAGKQNFAQKIPVKLRYYLLIILILLAIFPWLILKNIQFAKFLFFLQLLLLFAYSNPFVKLKKKVHLATITDALYSSLLPALIAFFLFSKNNLKTENIEIILIFTSILFLRGLRNILIHQIIDAENDQKSRITTFAIKYSKVNTLKIIHGIVIAEIIGIIGLTIILSLQINFWLGLIIPGFISYFLLKRFDVKNKNKDKIFYIQMLNDFYEDLLPLSFLVLLSIMNFKFLIVLIVHLTIFRNKIIFLLVEKILYGILYRKTCGLINRVLKTNF